MWHASQVGVPLNVSRVALNELGASMIVSGFNFAWRTFRYSCWCKGCTIFRPVDARVALFSDLSLEVLWPIVHIGLLRKLEIEELLGWLDDSDPEERELKDSIMHGPRSRLQEFLERFHYRYFYNVTICVFVKWLQASLFWGSLIQRKKMSQVRSWIITYIEVEEVITKK